MKPQRASYKKNADAFINCYCFQLDYATETKRLLINLNQNIAYFIDESMDLSMTNGIDNFFSEEWVQELIEIFLKNCSCQTFEYFFETKKSRLGHHEHLILNLFSNRKPESTCQEIIYKPI